MHICSPVFIELLNMCTERSESRCVNICIILTEGQLLVKTNISTTCVIVRLVRLFVFIVLAQSSNSA